MPKQQTQTEIEALDARIADARAVMNVLQEGLREIDKELDAIRLERYLSTSGLQKNQRALRDQLKELRESMRAGNAAPPAGGGDLPTAVAKALALLREGTQPPLKDARTVEQLEGNRKIIREAICEQTPIIEELVSGRGAAIQRTMRPEWDKEQLELFRALQVAAAKADVVRKRRQSVIADCGVWRPDILAEPIWRSVLVLGSESEWDSEISRARRTLEELKIL